MCGIAGLARGSRDDHAQLVEIARTTGRDIAHRGPDFCGDLKEDAGLVFSHERFSIIDLSENGHQPMVSRSGRWVICPNGEVHNHRELRAQLAQAGLTFRGTSDTEVFLECIDAWGIDVALNRSNGMFALAVYDRANSELNLARDRTS